MREMEWEELAGQVTEFTRRWGGDGGHGPAAALYLWGSCAAGKADGWSDLDLILVVPESDEQGLRDGVRWADAVYGRFGFRVDPLVMSAERLGRPDGHSAAAAWGLKGARLLWGEDVRHRLRLPGPELLRQCVVGMALDRVGALYGGMDGTALPATLPAVEAQRVQRSPAGNLAWQIASAAMAMLRAIALLDGGYLYSGREQLAAGLRACGLPDLATVADEATALRGKLSRWAVMDAIPDALAPMALAIPGVYEQLREQIGFTVSCGTGAPFRNGRY